ncbi:MAG: tetratricopeptide repeat protein [Phycisphaerae bacterium]|nr:tetratricopeptide repeat protein [Phycisphaerae bacterium]
MQDMGEAIGTAATLYEQGDYSRVVEVCRRVLQSREDWRLLHFVGKAAYQLGRYAQAEESVRRAIRQAAGEASIHNTLGVILEAQGRFDEAVAAYGQAVSLKGDFAEAWLNRAIALTSAGDTQSAERACAQALELRPDWARAHDVMGYVHQCKGAFQEAEASFRRAVELEAGYAEARNHLGAALNRRGDFAAAAAQLRQVVATAADYAEGWNNLGISEKGLGRLAEAAACFRRAVELDEGFAQGHYNLGNALRETGDCEGAIEAFERAIEWMPDFAWAHWNLSHALLACGRFDEGWRQYAWRHDKRLGIVTYPHEMDLPRWDGRKFDGRRLLVHYEQGLGDTIQFIRYLPMVKARGGTVVLEAPRQLFALFRECEGIDELIAAGPDKPAGHFDWMASPLDFPGIFGTQAETIPARVPYVFADVDKAQVWWPRLRGTALKIGIVWAGSPDHGRDAERSCSLEWFGPLARMEGVRAYSLQKGPAAEQLAQCDAAGRIVDLAGDFEDMSDLAAAMINLDLIISVDTAAAHLAGAMARPVWVVLPFTADWRWMTDRTDSPWYPTMQLFRQKSRGDWADVFQRVHEELKKVVKEHV